MEWLRRLRGDGEPRDRRAACRYRAIEGGAWLGWWAGGEFQATPARLRNVSLGGSLIVAGGLPERGQSVFVRLGGASAGEWVESDIVAARRQHRGGFEARLAFAGACPYDFFKDAVFGQHALDGPRPALC